jgi:hypothetical protein
MSRPLRLSGPKVRPVRWPPVDYLPALHLRRRKKRRLTFGPLTPTLQVAAQSMAVSSLVFRFLVPFFQFDPETSSDRRRATERHVRAA